MEQLLGIVHCKHFSMRRRVTLFLFWRCCAFNYEIGEELAEILTTYFLEAVIAPSIDFGAATVFQKKKNLKVFSHEASSENTSHHLDIRRVNGLFLIQEPDSPNLGKVFFDPCKDMKSVTSKLRQRNKLKMLICMACCQIR